MSEIHIVPGTTIGKYTILKELKRNDHISTFSVIDNLTQVKFTMEIEKKSAEKSILQKNIHRLKEFRNSPYFPLFHEEGSTDEYIFLVYELLGPSLASLLTITSTHCLSRFTVVYSSLEIFKCIRIFHSLGLAHGNIYPESIFLRNDSRHPIVLSSFDNIHEISPQPLASMYSNQPQTDSIESKSQPMESNPQTDLLSQKLIRYDLISWIFTIVFLLNGRLSWIKDIHKISFDDFEEKINNCDSTFFQNLPSQFFDIFQSLKGNETYIDYPKIQTSLEQALNFEPHELVDWKLYDLTSISEISFTAEPTRLPSIMITDLSDEDSKAVHEDFPRIYKGSHKSLDMGGNEDVIPSDNCCLLF